MMHSYITATLFLCVAVVASLPADWPNNYKTYKGYRVYEVIPKSREQVDLLRKWMLEENHFDFWKEPAKNLEPVHIMVNSRQAARLTVMFKKHGLDYTIHINNLSKDIEEFVSKEVQRRSNKQKAFNIDDFNTLDDIMDWLENDLMTQCAENNLVCSVDTTTYTTFEGRGIPVVTMSSDGSNTKPVYLMDATIHAREWLATGTILKIMDRVSTATGDEGSLVANNDIVFLPVYNPDGYEYSWTGERLWRKNRAENENSACLGVDLNRNCDYMFAAEGVSQAPCSDLYCGPRGNSEVETQAIDEILAQYSSRSRAYITFHSYGYMWMHPWGNTVGNNGFTCERADDHTDMFAVADATANAIENVYNSRWARGTSCEVIYETTGATDDYAKAVYDWKYPFTPELRGNSFIVPASDIDESFQEVWAGILAKEEAIP